MSENFVYVAEAYKNGERIEQLVHVNYADAREDIEVSTSTDDPDEIVVERRKLYLGESTKFVAERETPTTPNWP